MVTYVSMRVLDATMNDLGRLEVHPQVHVLMIRVRGLTEPVKLRMEELPTTERVLVAPPLPQGWVMLLGEKIRRRTRA
jgi:hypothetical protein